MFYVDCRGRLLDCFQPAEKEEKATAFTSWNGHAFFYKSARAVAGCDESEQRERSNQAISTPKTFAGAGGAAGGGAPPQGLHARPV